MNKKPMLTKITFKLYPEDGIIRIKLLSCPEFKTEVKWIYDSRSLSFKELSQTVWEYPYRWGDSVEFLISNEEIGQAEGIKIIILKELLGKTIEKDISKQMESLSLLKEVNHEVL